MTSERTIPEQEVVEDEDDILLDEDEDEDELEEGEIPDFDDDDLQGAEDPLLDLLGGVLTTEDGDTVCSALVALARQMEVQNKILIKMLSSMKN
jgi:hypothetical protein